MTKNKNKKPLELVLIDRPKVRELLSAALYHFLAMAAPVGGGFELGYDNSDVLTKRKRYVNLTSI